MSASYRLPTSKTYRSLAPYPTPATHCLAYIFRACMCTLAACQRDFPIEMKEVFVHIEYKILESPPSAYGNDAEHFLDVRRAKLAANPVAFKTRAAVVVETAAVAPEATIVADEPAAPTKRLRDLDLQDVEPHVRTAKKQSTSSAVNAASHILLPPERESQPAKPLILALPTPPDPPLGAPLPSCRGEPLTAVPSAASSDGAPQLLVKRLSGINGKRLSATSAVSTPEMASRRQSDEPPSTTMVAAAATSEPGKADHASSEPASIELDPSGCAACAAERSVQEERIGRLEQLAERSQADVQRLSQSMAEIRTIMGGLDSMLEKQITNLVGRIQHLENADTSVS